MRETEKLQKSETIKRLLLGPQNKNRLLRLNFRDNLIKNKLEQKEVEKPISIYSRVKIVKKDRCSQKTAKDTKNLS